ncbi:MAG: domain S-box protein [Nocardioides sp.]|jgi:PAS domain S-box-containing protein|uniref:sensor histidine kinase n=1 Tax=Nocardioides sp. TaxID=35761 RepID=UPI002623E8D7|nr:ATP-binding protein [Nocardioides sp.]MCW2834637.1 domain S-box protein [Nocardioides sp.]
MTTDWSRKRALVVALCLMMIVVPLSLEGLDYRSFGGFPAVGFAVALVVYLGRRWLWWTLLVETVVIVAALTRTYDVSPLLGIAGSITITVPALLVWFLLTRGDRTFEISTHRGEQRLILATAAGALVCGTLGGLFALAQVEPRDALLTGAMSFLSSLAAQLAVLPVLDRASRTGTAPKAEQWAQWGLLLVVVALVFGPVSTLPVLFVVPAALSWGANRGSPRVAHNQLLLVSVVAYLLTFLGRGPLALEGGRGEIAGPILLYVFLVACAYVTIPISGSVARLQRVTLSATQAASTMERLFESAHRTLIISADSKGLITRFNRGAELMLGYDADDVLGQPVTKLSPAEEVARHARRLGLSEDDFRSLAMAMAASPEPWDWKFVTNDGRQLVISLSLTSVADDDGEIVGFLGVGDDTTERHAADVALRRALDREHASVARLRDVDRVKQELVSNVSHELRTPITSIIGYVELLHDGTLGDLPSEQRQVVARIARNGHRLIRLVEDLLTLSQVEAGALVLQRAPTDLGAVVRAVCVLHETQLLSRSVELVMDIPDSPVILVADAHEVERVLVNLVGNSIKFTPDGGRVDVTLRAEEKAALITVSDTGIGIALDEQDQLFSRFFRASSATDNAIQGSGLGLSIAHAIVAAHDGTIEVESEPGKGTTMRVCLPREGREVADEPLFSHQGL